MSDLETRIAEVLLEHHLGGFVQDAPIGQMIGQCFCGHPLGEFPYAGAAQHQTAMLAPVIAEVKAEALREAAETLNAHADKNERDAVKLMFWTRRNLSGTYWVVRHNRTLARWLHARANQLVNQ